MTLNSRNPLKRRVVAALKRVHDVRKVTQVRQIAPGVYQAKGFVRGGIGRAGFWISVGFLTVTEAQVEAVAKRQALTRAVQP